MEDIVELMRNEKEDYGAAYECGVMDGEKRGEKRGEARGEKRWEKRGKKIGEVQGKKLGIASEKINIAKTMIQKKFNLDSISEITGLSIKELSKLSIT